MRSFGRSSGRFSATHFKAGRFAALAGLALMASGCASIRDHRGYIIDTALLDSVQPGIDNRQSVEKALGRPTFVSQFGDQSWYYVSQDTRQTAFRRPKTNSQTVLRVRFDQAGNVAGVDRAGMEHVVSLSPDGHKTPTLGRDRSLIEDLFGNIGSVGGPGGAPGGSGGPGGGPNGS
jgi:outer membrane protein assembly factor BamE (lipoprotein component of BamABCDE complex)